MITHVWTAVCRESMVDEETNNISLLEAYENLQFDVNLSDQDYKKGTSIGVEFKLEVVSLFFRNTTTKVESFKETLLVLDPKGAKLGDAVADVTFQAANDRMRNIMRFDTFAVTTSGVYLFQVFMSKAKASTKEPIAVVPVNVRVTVNGRPV
jgi:hypothetical protein